MTIFMEKKFCIGGSTDAKVGLKERLKVGGTYISYLLPVSHCQNSQGVFGPSENPNPLSSRTGKELLVVKQKQNFISTLNYPW